MSRRSWAGPWDPGQPAVRDAPGPTRVAQEPDPSYVAPPPVGFVQPVGLSMADAGERIRAAFTIPRPVEPLLWEGDQA